MGILSKLGDLGRNGNPTRQECANCGTTYSGTIDRGFPYAICGGCLEREGTNAKRTGDNSSYQAAQKEFRRRGTNWS